MENEAKNAVRSQFSQNAADYRDEALFANGDDLRYMVQSVRISGSERVLDVGSGAGHTAFAFAPFVEQCLGLDLTEAMVNVAKAFAKDHGIQNVDFMTGDAEHLPLPDESFDFATCRFAAHHFPSVKQAISEIERVLKPGGTFILVDHYAPEDPSLDAFVNNLDRLRDPSHVRENRLSEYKAWFEEVGLLYRERSSWDLRLQFENWVQRARTPLEVREKLIEILRLAPASCKDAFHIELDDRAQPVSFSLKCALIHGVKASV